MTSYKRKLYDRAHQKHFYGKRRNRDGNPVRYTKHDMLTAFSVVDHVQEETTDGIEDAFSNAFAIRRNLEG